MSIDASQHPLENEQKRKLKKRLKRTHVSRVIAAAVADMYFDKLGVRNPDDRRAALYSVVSRIEKVIEEKYFDLIIEHIESFEAGLLDIDYDKVVRATFNGKRQKIINSLAREIDADLFPESMRDDKERNLYVVLAHLGETLEKRILFDLAE